jgi:Rrf2 family iron-sulfur cluster assembly transcriptional regulator
MELLRRDTDYAVRALCEIAQSGEPVQASFIARAQDMPFDFLQKILRKLKDAGIVKVRRGCGGGFSLARPASGISLLSIVECVQGKIAVNRCFTEARRCPRQDSCTVRDKLAVLQESIEDLLEGATLAEVLNGEAADSAGR